MQKVTENYLSKVTRYFYFVTEQHWKYKLPPAVYTLSASMKSESVVGLLVCAPDANAFD